MERTTLGFHPDDAGDSMADLSTQPALDLVVRPGRPQPIPTEVEHEVVPRSKVRFLVEFLQRG